MEDANHMTAALYDQDTSRILALRFGSRQSISLESLPYVAGDWNPDTHYIDLSGDEPTPRECPAMPVSQDKAEITADGEDFMSLAGLPEPCRVRIGSAEYDVPDGALEWSTVMPAAYKIEVEAFPYLTWEGEVRAVEGDVQTE
ncbi:MAG: hypothetical protein LBS75_02485 [Synergistaceae bacterium]|jgi:hypothetical protein|nr:hypothetical protein [Synergistaceae bacterium]